MGFGLRMIVCGGASAIFGALWFLGGLLGEKPDSPLQGGIWKGPLLVLAGTGAIIMGFRYLRDHFKDSEDAAPDHSP
jgi:hypothetical protein